MDNPFAARRATLALAGHNSGTGWLANLLLELSIPLLPPGTDNPKDVWQPCADNSSTDDTWTLTPAGWRRLRGTLPAVHRRAAFSFPDDVCVQVAGEDAAALADSAGPVIVLRRDPREAFPGLWERGGTGARAWDDFVNQPGDNPLGLPPPEAWAVRALLWDALAAVRPVLVVQYENLRADTSREVMRVLAFLGVERDPALVAQAVATSSLERARETLAAAARAAGAEAAYPGRGQAGGDGALKHSPAGAAHFGGGLVGGVRRGCGYPSAERAFAFGGGGFAALREAAPADAQTVLGRAQTDMAGGNLGAALRRLAGAVSAVPGQADGDAALLATLTALRWTQLLFPDAPDGSPSVPRAFGLFCDLHSTCADAPWLRIAQMQTLTTYAPRHAGAFNIWGKTLHALGRPAEAEAVFEAACEIGAECAQIRSNLAVLAWQDGRRERALAQISRAAQMDPHEPSVAANLRAMQGALRFQASAAPANICEEKHSSVMTAPSLPSAQWRDGRQHELDFWKRFFDTKGWIWPQDLAARLDPQWPLQNSVRECLQACGRQEVSVLDVGAGPLTQLGKVWPGHTVHITAVDPLAAEYRTYLEESKLVPLVETQHGEAERLEDSYAPETFDLVYCINALDHSYDPLCGIQQMLRVVKTGGWVLLEHGTNEAVRQNYEGMHQWNFCNENGQFIIWNKTQRINVSMAVADQADVFLPPVADPHEWTQARFCKRAA